jgi:hypothetical protein
VTVSPQLPAKRPYEDLVDPAQLAKLEKVAPGSVDRVLAFIKRDMELQAERLEKQDEREYDAFRLSIWLTMIVVLAIAGMSTGVILAGHAVAGSVLATVDLVALATVFANAWRRNQIAATKQSDQEPNRSIEK